MTNLTLFFVIFFLVLHYASSTRTCYYSCSCVQCDANLTTLECPNEDDYCYTMKDSTGTLSKGCVSTELAAQICEGQNYTTCWSCVGDFCNSFGNRATSSLVLLITICILKTIFM